MKPRVERCSRLDLKGYWDVWVPTPMGMALLSHHDSWEGAHAALGQWVSRNG